MQRLGMQRQAQTFAHPALPAGHALSEHCLYRLSQQHWRQMLKPSLTANA